MSIKIYLILINFERNYILSSLESIMIIAITIIDSNSSLNIHFEKYIDKILVILILEF